ncbi:MAG: hypothetical protein KBG15_23490 [Kofleriaceae bacterium]|nr:hypothetical protein [Kofleriaceae bacterium]
MLISTGAAGCYSGARAANDVNAAWRGRPGAELKAAWGKHATAPAPGGGEVLNWVYGYSNGGGAAGVTIPTAVSIQAGCAADVHRDGANADCGLAVSTNSVHVAATVPRWTTLNAAMATTSVDGVVTKVEGSSLHWGPPDDANLRWGLIFGAHVGIGRIDTTSTPLPSGGMYIGGMLSPRFALVGNTSIVSGSDNAGGAMAFAWGMSAQWWPSMRLSLRGGPAMALVMDPGFDNARLAPAATSALAFAILRTGNFVLDLRADVTATPASLFGNVGVGVNLQ